MKWKSFKAPLRICSPPYTYNLNISTNVPAVVAARSRVAPYDNVFACDFKLRPFVVDRDISVYRCRSIVILYERRLHRQRILQRIIIYDEYRVQVRLLFIFRRRENRNLLPRTYE